MCRKGQPEYGLSFIHIYQDALLDCPADVKAKELEPGIRGIIQMGAETANIDEPPLGTPFLGVPPTLLEGAPQQLLFPGAQMHSAGGKGENGGAESFFGDPLAFGGLHSACVVVNGHPINQASGKAASPTASALAAIGADAIIGSPEKGMDEGGIDMLPPLDLDAPLASAFDDDDGGIWAMDVDSPSADDIGAVLRALDCSPRTSRGRLGDRGVVSGGGGGLRSSGVKGLRGGLLRQVEPHTGADLSMPRGKDQSVPGQGQAGAVDDVAASGVAAEDILRTTEALKGRLSVGAVEGWQDTFSGWSTSAAKEALGRIMPAGSGALVVGREPAGDMIEEDDLAFDAGNHIGDSNRRLTFGTFLI